MTSSLLFFKDKQFHIDQKECVNFIKDFASCGLYFDNISIVAYDNNAMIVQSLRLALSSSHAIVVICPNIMEQTIKSYIEKNLAQVFDNGNILSTQQQIVCLYKVDQQNRCSVEDFSKIILRANGCSYDKLYIKAVGLEPNEINEAMRELNQSFEHLQCNLYQDFEDFTAEILYDNTTPKMLINQAIRMFSQKWESKIYALENLTLPQRLFQLLQLRRMKLCVAESFTGGGVGKKLVELPGISEVFFEGLNTYANESKMLRLGVQEQTLKQYGAVSSEVAYQMAYGLIEQGNCNLAIATTGIAGPKSDNTSKPVGLCYIAVGTKENISVFEYHFKGTREQITNTAITHALFQAYKKIK